MSIGSFSLVTVNKILLVKIAMLFCIGVVGLSGCTDSDVDTEIDPRTVEEIVIERAQERLNVLLLGDVNKALAFTTPAYQQMTTAGQYHARVEGAARWTDAVTDSIVCEQDKCEVITMISYEHKALGFKNTREFKETWIKIDNQWWLYQH